MKNIRVMVAVIVVTSISLLQANVTRSSAAHATKSAKLNPMSSANKKSASALNEVSRPGQDGSGQQHLLGKSNGNTAGYKKTGDNKTAVDGKTAVASYTNKNGQHAPVKRGKKLKN